MLEELAADKAQIAKLAAALKEAEQVVRNVVRGSGYWAWPAGKEGCEADSPPCAYERSGSRLYRNTRKRRRAAQPWRLIILHEAKARAEGCMLEGDNQNNIEAITTWYKSMKQDSMDAIQ